MSFAKWYTLDEYHVGRVLLGKQREEITADWKQLYAEYVHDWNHKHFGDNFLGYKLIYMDDDAVPELCLSCDNEYGGELLKIYTIIDNKVSLIVDEMYVYGECRGTYYEKLGFFIISEGYCSGSGSYGHMLKDGMLIHDVFEFETINIIKNDATNGDAYCITMSGYTYIDDNYEVHQEVYDETNVDTYISPDDLITDAFKLEKGTEKNWGDNSDYKTICSELGVEPKYNISEQYDTYYVMMKKYLNGNPYSSDCIKLEGVEGTPFYAYDYTYKFGLMDIDQNGTEELIVKPVLNSDYDNTFFVLVPEEDYTKSVVGYYYNCYDEKNHWLGVSSGLDCTYEYTFYKLTGNTTEETCYYMKSGDLEGDGTCNEFRKCDNSGRYDITEAEFEAELSNVVYDLNVDWYELNDDNLKKVFLGIE